MLREYFYNYKRGPGIWKWDHYFEIYERHFGKFVGQEVHALEIGVYSGGSLHMWREYFGPKSHIYGVDIEPACKIYEAEGTIGIFVGDQADREFWARFREAVPHLDLVIDDGGHSAEQQIVSFEELLPHLRPGGVYCCEDIHGYPDNDFADYLFAFSKELNDHRGSLENVRNNDRRAVKDTTKKQAEINSVHLYPYLAIIEKNAAPIKEFIAPKRGSEWQPFIK